MLSKDSRIAVSVTSGANETLLRHWAHVTGRSLSSLAAFLLEDAIREALRKGDVPTASVRHMDSYIADLHSNAVNERGTAIHTAVEEYLASPSIDVPPCIGVSASYSSY